MGNTTVGQLGAVGIRPKLLQLCVALKGTQPRGLRITLELPLRASVCTSCLALGFTIGDLRSQLEGHDGKAVRRQPPPPSLALPLRELNPED